MTDETKRKISKAVKISLIIANLVLVANGVWHWWHGRSSSISDNNVTRTVESIQRANESARSEVESGRREIEAAEGHIERAADAVGRSEEAARTNAAGVDELQTLVGECRGIVENQRELIREVETANGIGTPEGKEG